MKRIVSLAFVSVLVMVAVYFQSRAVRLTKESNHSEQVVVLPDSEIIGHPSSQVVSNDLSEHYFANYGTSQQSPVDDLLEVDGLLADFRAVAGREHDLPTEGNRELVRFLSSENPSGFVYLTAFSAPIGETGEFVDRWGQALYFHFESSEEVGIRSAGEDGEMWSEDDVFVVGGAGSEVLSK